MLPPLRRRQQIHKIPGTIYAQAKVDSVAHVSPSDCWMGTEEDQDASFKARMEALADPLSTNLYMEGLPLSIDEPVRCLFLYQVMNAYVWMLLDSVCARHTSPDCF